MKYASLHQACRTVTSQYAKMRYSRGLRHRLFLLRVHSTFSNTYAENCFFFCISRQMLPANPDVAYVKTFGFIVDDLLCCCERNKHFVLDRFSFLQCQVKAPGHFRIVWTAWRQRNRNCWILPTHLRSGEGLRKLITHLVWTNQRTAANNEKHLIHRTS